MQSLPYHHSEGYLNVLCWATIELRPFLWGARQALHCSIQKQPKAKEDIWHLFGYQAKGWWVPLRFFYQLLQCGNAKNLWPKLFGHDVGPREWVETIQLPLERGFLETEQTNILILRRPWQSSARRRLARRRKIKRLGMTWMSLIKCSKEVGGTPNDLGVQYGGSRDVHLSVYLEDKSW